MLRKPLLLLLRVLLQNLLELLALLKRVLFRLRWGMLSSASTRMKSEQERRWK